MRIDDVSYEVSHMGLSADEESLLDKKVIKMENAGWELKSWALRGED